MTTSATRWCARLRFSCTEISNSPENRSEESSGLSHEETAKQTQHAKPETAPESKHSNSTETDQVKRERPPPPRRPSRVPHGLPGSPTAHAGQESSGTTDKAPDSSATKTATDVAGAAIKPVETKQVTKPGRASASASSAAGGPESKAASARDTNAGSSSAPASPSHRPHLATETTSSPSDVQHVSGLQQGSSSRRRMAWGQVPNAQSDTVAAQDAIGKYITKVHEVRSEVADVQAYVDILDRAIEELQAKRALAGGRDAVLHHERRLARQIDLLEKRILQTKEGYMKASAQNLELKAKVDARRREKLALRRAINARTDEGNALAQTNSELEDDITQLVAARHEVESQLDGVQEESRMALGTLEREYEELHAQGDMNDEAVQSSATTLVGLVHGTEHAANRAAASAEGERNASGVRQVAAGKAAAARARALPAIAKGGSSRPGSRAAREGTASRLSSSGGVRVGSGTGNAATERLVAGKGGAAGVQMAMKQQRRRQSAANSPAGWDTASATPRSATGGAGTKGGVGASSAPQAARRRKAAKQLSSGLLNVGAIEKGHLHSADGTLFYGGTNKAKYNVSHALAGGAMSPVAPMQSMAGGSKIHSPLTAKETPGQGGVGFIAPVSPTLPPSTPSKAAPALQAMPPGSAGAAGSTPVQQLARGRSDTQASDASPNTNALRRDSVTAHSHPFGTAPAEAGSTLSLRQTLPAQSNWSEVWAIISATTGQDSPEQFAKRFHTANDANYDLYLRVDALAKEADDLRLAVMRCQHELRSSQLTTAVVDAERTLAMTDVQGRLLGVRHRRSALGERLENVYACEAALGDVLSRMIAALDFSNVGGKTSPRRARATTIGHAGGMSQRRGGVKSGEGAGSPSTTASGGSHKAAAAGGGKVTTVGANEPPSGPATKATRSGGDGLAASLSTGQRLIRQHRLLEQRLRQVLVIFKQSGGDIVALARAQPTPSLSLAKQAAAAAASSVVEALRTAGGVLGDPSAAMSAEDASAGDGPIKAEMSRRQRRRSVDMSVIEIRRGMLAGANDAYASEEEDDDDDEEGAAAAQAGAGDDGNDVPSEALAHGTPAGAVAGPAMVHTGNSVSESARSGATTQRRRKKNAASVLDERMMILGPDQPGVHGLPTAPLLRTAPPSSTDDGSALRAAEAAVAEFVARRLL